MKKSKALLLALCAAALSVGVTFGTLAYLTDTEAVTNTFTVGQVHISLDEENVDKKDAEGKDNADEPRDKANKYHLIPGQTYKKDPIVHVRADSESSWVFVKVENGISEIEAASVKDGYQNITDQIAANGWTKLEGITGVTNVYYQMWDKEEDKNDRDLEVFQNFKIAGDGVDNDDIDDYAEKEIKVTAYAIQAAGFENNVSGAWAAFVDQNADLFR